MDEIDRGIVAELERAGRTTFRDLAARVRLGPTATADRVRRLEELGVIRGYRAVVDRQALGYLLEAFVDVRVAPGVAPAAAERVIGALPEVVEIHDVTGTFDYQLRVVARSPEDLSRITGELRRDVPLVETQTRLVLRDVTRRG